MPVDTERVLAALLGVAFEVGAGGVEEQQVDLEVKQAGDGEEHRLLHLGLGVGLHQQVHRAVSLVLIHRLQAVDGHVVAGHSAAGSSGIGSMARLAASANSTRSTSVVNRRGPSTLRSAVSTPSACHNPSSRCTGPTGRAPATVSPSPASSAASAGGSPASGSPR